MKCNLMVKRLALVSMVMASGASAQTAHLTSSDVEGHNGEPLNRFGISYRAGFNISAKFKNVGGYKSPLNRDPVTGAAQYDDGYIGVDPSGNLGNETQAWGYTSGAQYQGDAIVMSSSGSPANGATKNQYDDPQHGVEFTYNRQLGLMDKTKWGIEAAFNYTDVTMNDRGTVFGDVNKARYAYALGGNVPPPAPYSYKPGYFPAPLLSTIPSLLPSVTVPGGATTTGSRNFDADIFGLRVGPYFEFPMSERFSFLLSGGLSLLVVSSDFKYHQTTSIEGLPSQSQSGSGSHSDVLGGSYVGGNIVYALSKSVSLSVGAQYQANGHYQQVEDGQKAQIDLGQSYFLTVGLGYSF